MHLNAAEIWSIERVVTKCVRAYLILQILMMFSPLYRHLQAGNEKGRHTHNHVDYHAPAVVGNVLDVTLGFWCFEGLTSQCCL